MGTTHTHTHPPFDQDALRNLLRSRARTRTRRGWRFRRWRSAAGKSARRRTRWDLGDKIGYIIANTYDQAEQSPKCEAVPGQNGPDGAVDPNSFDTQNIVACHVQVTEGLNYNFQLNAKDGVLFCDVHWSESPEYDCSLHKHAKNKWPCVDPGTCSKHCLHHGCKQE